MSKYTKFIILGTARTGSNLLWSYLNSHPDVLCLRGVFGATKKINFGKYYKELPSEYSNEKLISYRNNNPIDFVEKYIFKQYKLNFKAIGFKYFYNHNRHLKNKDELVNYFVNNSDIKFIHIKRRNLLATLYSYKRALEQNKWINTDLNYKTEISIKESLDFFKTTIEFQNYFDNIFKERIIEVVYEDFINNKNKTLLTIQEFLEINPFVLKTDLKKNIGGKLSEMIINYEELKVNFKNTEYEKYFE